MRGEAESMTGQLRQLPSKRKEAAEVKMSCKLRSTGKLERVL